MSFACRFPSSARFVLPGIPLASSYSSTGTGSEVSLSVIFKSDGSLVVSRVQGDSGSSTLLTSAWFSLTEAGIGNSYWARVSITGGSNPGAPTGSYTSGVWYQISTDIDFKWRQTSAGTKDSICTFEIASNALGTNVVGSVSGVTVTCTYS